MTKGVSREKFKQWIEGRDWLDISITEWKNYTVYLTPQGNIVWVEFKKGKNVIVYIYDCVFFFRFIHQI